MREAKVARDKAAHEKRVRQQDEYLANAKRIEDEALANATRVSAR